MSIPTTEIPQHYCSCSAATNGADHPWYGVLTNGGASGGAHLHHQQRQQQCNGVVNGGTFIKMASDAIIGPSTAHQQWPANNNSTNGSLQQQHRVVLMPQRQPSHSFPTRPFLSPSYYPHRTNNINQQLPPPLAQQHHQQRMMFHSGAAVAARYNASPLHATASTIVPLPSPAAVNGNNNSNVVVVGGGFNSIVNKPPSPLLPSGSPYTSKM